MEMRFLHPSFLLLLAVVPLVWIWPVRVRSITHGLLRSAVLALLALALAGPVALTSTDRVHHAVVLDLSASSGTAEKLSPHANRLAEDLGDLGPTTLVAIGGKASQDLLDAYDTVATVDGVAFEGSSPLSSGLAVAARAIPRGVPGAITLLTDGRATARRWGSTIQALTARGIPVHVVAARPPSDVRPVGLTVPGEIRTGHTARLRAHLAGDARAVDVRLSSPAGPLTTVRNVAVSGSASVVLEFEPPEPGFLPLTISVAVREGANPDPANDSLSTVVAVQDPLRLLYLGSRIRDGGPALERLLGPGFRVDATAGKAAFYDYDVVVLDDRPADSVPETTQRALARAVTEQGTGLFFSGGRAAFGPGGWREAPLAAVLPVDLVQREEKRDPSTTLVVIIDTSGSMGGTRVQLAKEVARLAIRRLLPHDKVGIVEFYGAKRWAAPIQPASNAIEIQRALNRLQAGGGTVILPAIEEAFYAMQNVRTRFKHVLVLTDGGVERGSFEPLLRRMAEEGMTVSTVLIGPEAHSEFLVNLANWGKGRFYSVPNRFNLPEVLLKQPASARLPAYRPGSFPLEARGSAGWWGRVDRATVPPLAGYVETRAREGATTVLATESGGHPVLASWQYGLGRVTTFMTEPVGPGTSSWADWAGYGPFLARVLRRTAATDALPLRFAIARRGIEVEVLAVRTGVSRAEPEARLDTGGVLAFREVAPGRFSSRSTVAPEREVRVLAGVRGDAAGRVTRLVSPALQGVAAESQVDPREELPLERLARVTGGSFARFGETTESATRSGGGRDPRAVRALAPWLTLMALLLYLGEIAWRRWPRRGRLA